MRQNKKRKFKMCDKTHGKIKFQISFNQIDRLLFNLKIRKVILSDQNLHNKKQRRPENIHTSKNTQKQFLTLFLY